MTTANAFLFEAPFGYREKRHPTFYSEREAEQGAPQLIKVENVPSSNTLYVDIRLGEPGHTGPEAPAKPMTSIFFPDGYHVQQSVDLIVYLHGWKQDNHRTWSIDRYLRDLPQRAFREKINESQKNVVLVAPTLGVHANAGWLVKPGGFDRYMDLVMQGLKMSGPYEGQQPTIGNIILASHSAGGARMRLIAGGGLPMQQSGWAAQRYPSFIRECWGFDCTYDQKGHVDSKEWGIWAENRSEAQLYIYYIRNSGTAVEAELLQRQGRSNVTVVPSSTKTHDLVPITYWLSRLQQSSFLNNR